MKIILAVTVTALVAGAGLYAAQESQEMPKPQKEHEWLQQIVGEWDSVADMGGTTMKGTESGRSIGGFWVMCETKAEYEKKPFTGILTLGYSAEKKKYIGTWIDSVTGYLWSYEGAVDAAGKKLTLESTGPGFDGKPCTFRESIEIKDKDHKEFTSAVEKDGKWMTHMTVKYTRKK